MFSPLSDNQFIEERRKALKRYLNLLARHPVINEDKILHFFLTFAGTVCNVTNDNHLFIVFSHIYMAQNIFIQLI